MPDPDSAEHRGRSFAPIAAAVVFPRGHNIVKAGYRVIDPKVGTSLHLFTVQLQIFYF